MYSDNRGSWRSWGNLFGGNAKRKNSGASRPSLEQLEDRMVPSTLSLTTAGAQGVFNGAIFLQGSQAPSAAGSIHSFVEIQSHRGTIEQGYNADARPLQFNELHRRSVTHSLLLSKVPTVTSNGVVYREFVLDINQTTAQPLLSLDELRIYVGNRPNMHGYNARTHTLGGLTPVYDMGAGNWVTLDARLGVNGLGDLALYVPDSAFAGAKGKYVYLYSKFGVHNAANGGFEEWGTPANPTPPPPQFSSLSGFVYSDLNNNGIKDPGEAGIAGVRIILSGTNSLGQAVNIKVTTDANGFYHFDNLLPGTYTITSAEPTGAWIGGKDTIGSQGGTTGSDVFNIILGAGITGINNNFGELALPGS